MCASVHQVSFEDHEISPPQLVETTWELEKAVADLTHYNVRHEATPHSHRPGPLARVHPYGDGLFCVLQERRVEDMYHTALLAGEVMEAEWGIVSYSAFLEKERAKAVAEQEAERERLEREVVEARAWLEVQQAEAEAAEAIAEIERAEAEAAQVDPHGVEIKKLVRIFAMANRAGAHLCPLALPAGLPAGLASWPCPLALPAGLAPGSGPALPCLFVHHCVVVP